MRGRVLHITLQNSDLIFPGSAIADVHAAASYSRSDVSAAYKLAIDGDTHGALGDWTTCCDDYVNITTINGGVR